MKQSAIPFTSGKNKKITIVLPYFNEHIGAKILEETLTQLKKNGCIDKNLEIVRVPGVLEIPLAVQKIFKTTKTDTVIALGVVIRGDTYHFELVCQTSFQALMDISLKFEKSVIFGILTVENEKQAIQRIYKGKEFADAALFMLQ